MLKKQFQDKITIEAQVYCTESQPLREFEEEIRDYLVKTDFVYNGLKRQYIAHWKIEENKLYLVEIKVITDNELKSVFPENKEKIFANWFSGEIIIESEKSSLLSSIFKDYNFQKKFHYTFKNGVQTAFYPIDYMERKFYTEPF